MQAESLDETVTDPLSAVEREAVTKLREHDAVVAGLKEDLENLRKRSSNGITMAELRRLVEEANRVESLLGVPREVLSQDALTEAEWPATDLVQARRMLEAVTANETATEAARTQLQAEDEPGNVGTLCTAQCTLLKTWSALRDIEADITQRANVAVSRVDLGMEARASVISPLCAALLDKAATVIRKGKSDAETRDAGLAAFAPLKEESNRQLLQALDVELPSDIFDDTPEPVREASFAETVVASPTSAPDAAEGKTALPGDEFIASLANIEGGDCTGQAAAAADAAASAVASAAAAIEATSAGEAPQETLRAPLDSPFAIGKGAVAPATAPEVDDPLLRTIPSISAQVVASNRSSPSPSLAVGATSVKANSSQQRYLAPSGTAELWHAVHVGDVAAVRRSVESGGCNGSTRDASGHSILWHSIAFAHMNLANYMLDSCPPGSSDKGVEVTEIHQRKGDTLLHLICQSKGFGADTAHVFKRLAAAAPDDLFQRVNQAGLTFFQIAASALNFWVLTFMLRNFPKQAKALICMHQHAPLRNMSEAIPQPSPPTYMAPKTFPEHFHIAEMLQPDESGVVPYADVAFDVGPDGGGAGAGRFFAHRIVVASESPVLMEKLAKLPLTQLEPENVRAAVFRVDPRISKEVWRTALQFMYTGLINAPFKGDVQKVVELLRACVAYQLPQPLLDFAQSCLYPLLPSSPPQLALQVFSICAGSTSEGMDVGAAREASTFILLRSSHKLLENMDAVEACQILEKLVQSAEHRVFNPPKKPAEAAQAAEQKSAAEPAAAQAAPPATAPSMDLSVGSARGAGHPMQGYTSWTPQSDRLSQSMYSTPRMVSQREMLSQGRPTQQDMLSQSMRVMPTNMQGMRAPGPDMLSQSMRSLPTDAMSQSMRAPGPDMLSQSMRNLPTDALGVQRMQSAPQGWNMPRGYPQPQASAYPGGQQGVQSARFQQQQGQPMMQQGQPMMQHQVQRMQSVPNMQPMMHSGSFQVPRSGSFHQAAQPNLGGGQPMVYRGQQAQQWG